MAIHTTHKRTAGSSKIQKLHYFLENRYQDLTINQDLHTLLNITCTSIKTSFLSLRLAPHASSSMNIVCGQLAISSCLSYTRVSVCMCALFIILH